MPTPWSPATVPRAARRYTIVQFSTLAGTLDKPGAAAGDVVVASLFQSGTSTWAEIHDLTANAFWFANNTVNQGDTVVDIGTYSEVSSSGRPVPTFTTANFTNATVNGDYLGFDSPTEVNALNGGDLLIKSGKLHTTGTGSVFTETFKHASHSPCPAALQSTSPSSSWGRRCRINTAPTEHGVIDIPYA